MPATATCTGLLFFDPALQRAYKSWLSRIYADVNPYTGVALAKDPAVAVIQIQNEDSLLFWSMQSIRGEALKNLCMLYGQWVPEEVRDVRESQGRVAVVPARGRRFRRRPAGAVHGLAADAGRAVLMGKLAGNVPGREARLADQAEFLGRIMYDFNREIAHYLRDELGCKQLINAGNWSTADHVVLDDVERWSYTANEVIGKNYYFSGIHNGLSLEEQILPGHVLLLTLIPARPARLAAQYPPGGGAPVHHLGKPVGDAVALPGGGPAR